MHRRTALLVLSLIIVLGLWTPGVGQAQPDRLHIAASFSILADVVANVADDAADVTSLMPLYADPHGFSPTPQDLVALADADVIFVVGANFEESLMKAIENAGADVDIVTASSCVEIFPFSADGHDDTTAPEATPEVSAAENETAARCEAHHTELAALQDGETTASESGGIEPLGMLYTLSCGGHDTDSAVGVGCDPHVWTDPHNVMLWTLMIRDTLSERDPAHADIYAANADAYLDELVALTDEIVQAVDAIPPERRVLVTNHLAFGYYARAFGFELVGVIVPGGSSLAEPSAAEIAALIDTIRAQHVPAVFAETTANPQLAEQIAAETGAAFYSLYTGSLSEPDGPAATYLDYMRYNTRTIVEALGEHAQE